jgi:flagellin
VASTKFNGLAILGTDAGTLTFQVGANTDDTVDITTTSMTDGDVATASAGSVSDVASAQSAMDDIDAALTTVNTERALYGASQNRFESIIGTLQVASENQAAARGRIMDADFAAETANLSRSQILQQAGTAMVAQANALPQGVLALLR